jgi:hypothetical protein
MRATPCVTDGKSPASLLRGFRAFVVKMQSARAWPIRAGLIGWAGVGIDDLFFHHEGTKTTKKECGSRPGRYRLARFVVSVTGHCSEMAQIGSNAHIAFSGARLYSCEFIVVEANSHRIIPLPRLASAGVQFHGRNRFRSHFRGCLPNLMRPCRSNRRR